MQFIVLTLIFISVLMTTTGCLKEPKVDLCGIIGFDESNQLVAECVPQDGSQTYMVIGDQLLGYTATSPQHTSSIKSHHFELHERCE